MIRYEWYQSTFTSIAIVSESVSEYYSIQLGNTKHLEIYSHYALKHIISSMRNEANEMPFVIHPEMSDSPTPTSLSAALFCRC